MSIPRDIFRRDETSANLLGVSEEARIRADKETQESWEVILNNKIPDVTDDDQLVFFQVGKTLRYWNELDVESKWRVISIIKHIISGTHSYFMIDSLSGLVISVEISNTWYKNGNAILSMCLCMGPIDGLIKLRCETYFTCLLLFCDISLSHIFAIILWHLPVTHILPVSLSRTATWLLYLTSSLALSKYRRLTSTFTSTRRKKRTTRCLTITSPGRSTTWGRYISEDTISDTQLLSSSWPIIPIILLTSSTAWFVN